MATPCKDQGNTEHPEEEFYPSSPVFKNCSTKEKQENKDAGKLCMEFKVVPSPVVIKDSRKVRGYEVKGFFRWH